MRVIDAVKETIIADVSSVSPSSERKFTLPPLPTSSLITLSLPRVINAKSVPPAVSPEISHHTVWSTWLFKAYSDERCYQFSLPHVYISLIKGCENVLFERGSERLRAGITSHYTVPKSAVSSHSTVLGMRPASLWSSSMISCTRTVCQSIVSVRWVLRWGVKEVLRQSTPGHCNTTARVAHKGSRSKEARSRPQ